MAHEGMVDALREIRRVLTPEGRLLDLRPIAEDAPIDITEGDQVQKILHINGSPGVPNDVASDKAVARVVEDRTFAPEGDRTVLFYRTYWDAAQEMIDYVLTQYTSRYSVPAPEEFEPVRAAFESAGPDARIRASKRLSLDVYRPL